MASQAFPEPFSMTSTHLGVIVGLSQPTISRIRHGERLPSESKWVAICHTLGVHKELGQHAWDNRAKGGLKILLDKVIPL